MNKFYNLHIVIQWIVALVMVLAMMLILNVWIDIINAFIPAILLIFLIVPIIQFLVTPLFTLLRLYTYLSPMLVVFAANNKRFDLHNGTSFDYMMTMSNLNSGTQFRKKMLEYFIDGLLTIAEKIEANSLQQNLVIRGSSYFLSSNTSLRLGFKLSNTNIFEKINIVLNYADLVWMYSLAQGKLSFPNLANIKTVSITGGQLLKNKMKLLELKQYFNSKSTDNRF